jgi:hypothetical protein
MYLPLHIIELDAFSLVLQHFEKSAHLLDICDCNGIAQLFIMDFQL